MLNDEIKKKWVTALRSGEYKQCQSWLHKADGYCCLGVLCDLYSQESNTKWEYRSEYFNYSYSGCMKFLPDLVYTWANMSPDMAYGLAAMNDNDRTFEQIADFIEAKY